MKKHLSRPHVFRPEDSAICVVADDGTETAVMVVEDLAYVDVLCDLPRIKRFLEHYVGVCDGTIDAGRSSYADPATAKDILRRMP